MKNELYHWGILGQKWGIRRYQYENGTYTEEGKIRKRRDRYSDDAADKKYLNKLPTRQLTNDELQRLNKRLELESKRSQYNSRDISSGKAFLKSVTKMAVTALIAGKIVNIINTGSRKQRVK